jgi:ATP-dependent DNA ligase
LAKFRVNRSQELVVGGYIPSAMSFDSLLVGFYQAGNLIFAARVRSGFTLG